jgi:membrane protein YdbS with pleckstrin-like domain
MEKDEREPGELVLKTSRLSYLYNYFIGALAIIFLLLFIGAFGLEFSFFPKTNHSAGTTLATLGLLAIAAWVIEQPELARFMRTYIVTRDEVIEIEGILTKRKIILPYQSISEVTVRKGPIGRMLNYGDVFIGAFRTGSDINMKGIKNAHKIHELIQNRINLLRKGQLDFWEKAKDKKEIDGD